MQADGQHAALDELNAHRLDENPNASLAKAGQAIGRSKSTAGNYIQELIEAGRIRKNGTGWLVTN